MTVVGVLAAPWLAELLTSGAPPTSQADQAELVTYLLRFFIPQILLYAAGTIATAVLYALRRFAVTAAAPIGNTIVMVACLAVFRVVAGPDPGLDADDRGEAAARGRGHGWGGRLRRHPRRRGAGSRGSASAPAAPARMPQVAEVLRHSGWGVVLHTGAGLLLGTAIVAGGGVEGGVVAYQVGWVIFLAPYAVLAQPIHTAILPELVVEAASTAWRGSRRRCGGRSSAWPSSSCRPRPGWWRWPSRPCGSSRSARRAARAASCWPPPSPAWRSGLLPYSAFLLLARGSYALGDSRTPGVVSVASTLVGVAVMVVGSVTVDGAARIFVLGLGHTVAYGVGVVVLGVILTRRTGGSLWPAALGRIVAVAAVVGAGAWWVADQLVDAGSGRLADLAVVAGIGLVGTGLILVADQLLGVRRALSRRDPTATLEPGPTTTAEPTSEVGA